MVKEPDRNIPQRRYHKWTTCMLKNATATNHQGNTN